MAWAVCLLACTLAAPLRAQTGDDPAALFQQGKQLYGEGKFEEAYQAYKRAFELQPAFDIAGNLGNVEVKLGKHRDAVVHLRYVLANMPPSYDPERREQISQRTKELLAESLKHVASIKLAITPDGTEVAVDNEKMGTTPLRDDVVLAPGKHTLVATRQGYQTLTHEVDAAAGTTETLRMSLSPVGNADPGTVTGGSSQADTGDDGPIWPLVIVGGVLGLGAMGAGIGLFVAASGKTSDRDVLAAQIDPDSGACNASPPDPRCAELQDLNDDANTFSAAGTGLLIGGGVILAATIVYMSVTLATSTSEARLELVPLPGGALLRGSF